MSAEHVILEPHDGVTIVRLDRPPANAFCLELARAFDAALDSRAVKEADALVVVGAGRFFSGGLDLKLVPAYSGEEQREFLGVLNRVIGRLYGIPVPVIGAINGHAVAGALILALATDYRVGPVGEARFGLTEARVGIPFPAVPMIVLHAECAPQDVRYSTLLARTFGPEEALRRGMLDELVPPEAVLGRAMEVARDMASMPSDGYRRIKHQVRRAALARIEAVLSAGDDPMLGSWLSPQAREASAALLEAPRER
jgi:enoyl-CoA hydratase